MSKTLPRVTVLIPSRPGPTHLKAVEAARQLHYPADRLEIIVAWGHPIPAIKRNRAIRAATGDLVYFLDDDSVPDPDNLQRAVSHFEDERVQVMGGPSVCPRDAPFLEHLFAAVMGNGLAFGPSCARYRPVGTRRDSSEKELILCNLLMARGPLLAAGGFDETLYPNEENALMDAMQKQGGRLLYDPEMIAYRRPRHSLGAFARMLMTYGRGRAEQFRLHPTLGSAANFVPPLFCLYLLLLAVLPLWLWWPLLLYGVMVVWAGLTTLRHPRPPSISPPQRILMAILAGPLIFMTHLLYGFGFWRGLLGRLQKDQSLTEGEIRLETVKV